MIPMVISRSPFMKLDKNRLDLKGSIDKFVNIIESNMFIIREKNIIYPSTFMSVSMLFFMLFDNTFPIL